MATEKQTNYIEDLSKQVWSVYRRNHQQWDLSLYVKEIFPDSGGDIVLLSNTEARALISDLRLKAGLDKEGETPESQAIKAPTINLTPVVSTKILRELTKDILVNDCAINFDTIAQAIEVRVKELIDSPWFVAIVEQAVNAHVQSTYTDLIFQQVTEQLKVLNVTVTKEYNRQ